MYKKVSLSIYKVYTCFFILGVQKTPTIIVFGKNPLDKVWIRQK